MARFRIASINMVFQNEKIGKHLLARRFSTILFGFMTLFCIFETNGYTAESVALSVAFFAAARIPIYALRFGKEASNKR